MKSIYMMVFFISKKQVYDKTETNHDGKRAEIFKLMC